MAASTNDCESVVSKNSRLENFCEDDSSRVQKSPKVSSERKVGCSEVIRDTGPS